MEKSDSLGTKSRRKRLWDYLGGRKSNQFKTNMAEFSGEFDFGDNSKSLTQVDSNKIEVIERSKSEGINLREEDVPGAILPRETPEECTVKQLHRWLLCRGAKTTGKKMQLVQR